MKNEKILKDFVVHTYELANYWALAKIDSIRNREHIDGFTSEEYDLMHKLIEDDSIRIALEKLLADCGNSNAFSACSYIDGASGVKSVELVSADTGEPIAEHMLHEHLVPLPWGAQWSEMMSEVTKAKERLIDAFKNRKEPI